MNTTNQFPDKAHNPSPILTRNYIKGKKLGPIPLPEHKSAKRVIPIKLKQRKLF
jgi:hypothetical protein